MKTCTKLITVLLIFFISIPTTSQVTIGMGETPAKTALLQLKDQSADENNITSKTGGFLLPRVGLVNLKTLQPFVETSEAGYADEKKSSVGLFVYNINRLESDSIYPGLYYWDGEQWDMISTRINQGNNNSGAGNDTIREVEPPLIDVEDPKTLNLSNCYIVGYGKTVDIPIIKAFTVWIQRLDADLHSLESGTLSVELLWQDRPDLIKSVSLEENSVKTKSRIRLSTNDQHFTGNAVIAIKINGTIYWSWHIWVTDFNPDDATHQKNYNGYVFMDRNLGVTFINEGAVGSKGLHYQWGRKDPFPNSSSTTGNSEKDIYRIDNSLTSISKTDIMGVPLINNNHMETAINNPNNFYYTSSSQGDWYSNVATEKDDYLWDEVGTHQKTPYDPCPPGWRVPKANTSSSNPSPWDGLPSENFVAGTGIDFSSANAGYYPAAGYRSGTNGQLTDIGHTGYVWYGSVLSVEYYAFKLLFAPYNTATNDRAFRAVGASVRCVKE